MVDGVTDLRILSLGNIFSVLEDRMCVANFRRLDDNCIYKDKVRNRTVINTVTFSFK